MTVHKQESHEDLIQRSLDGELSNSGQRRLSELLASSDQARNAYDHLKKVDSLLSRAPMVDPPSDLAARVMAGLRARHHRAAPASISRLLDRISDALRAKPAYGISLGFALGVLVLLPMALQMPANSLDSATMSGTMTNGTHVSGVFEARPLSISSDLASGSCQALITLDQVTLVLNLETAAPMEIELEHDGTGPGLASVLVGSGTVGYMESQGRIVRLLHEGRNSYQFRFQREPGAILDFRLSLLQDGQIVFRETIPSLGQEH
jgi:hypothetical protein